jgi:hypothetical protein
MMASYSIGVTRRDPRPGAASAPQVSPAAEGWQEASTQTDWLRVPLENTQELNMQGYR